MAHETFENNEVTVSHWCANASQPSLKHYLLLPNVEYGYEKFACFNSKIIYYLLDQSFSAENFRNIFHIENRKGNLQKAMFPAQYIDLIKDIKSLKTEIKEKSKERKDGTITKEEYQSFKDEKNNKIKDCKKKKDDILYEQVKDISTMLIMITLDLL